MFGATADRITQYAFQVLQGLRHPNVTQLYEVLDGPNSLCLVLQYNSGKVGAHYGLSENKADKVENYLRD